MLATNPRISQVAGMVKHYAPLKPKFAIEMTKLLATTDEFNALPQWLQDHLLKVEQMFEADKSNAVAKHGTHDQKTHGRRKSIEAVSFTQDELQTIQDYTTFASIQINEKLRGKRSAYGASGQLAIPDNRIDAMVKNMDSAIDKSSLSEKLTLRRDIPTNSLKRGIGGTKVGQVISEKGFLSLRQGTTEVPPMKGFMRLVVNAPAGAKGLDMSFLNSQHFGEIIFPRDTKIKITQIKGFGDDTEIRGEIVG